MFIPVSTEEVEEVTVTGPPHKANAGGLVEGQQGSNDDVLLRGGCREKEQRSFIHVLK